MPAVKLDEGEESVAEVGSRTAQPPSRQEVIQTLHACYDPCCRDRKISVVDMGLIEGYGYPPLTEQAKRKILGENLARLHGMDVDTLRRIFAHT
jgi:hypothetical protein